MDKYYVIFDGISAVDVVYICNLVGMHNLAGRSSYVKIWLTDEEKITKLYKVLTDLDVKFDIAKNLNFEE